MDVLTKAKFRIFRDMKWIKRIILAVLFLIVALVIFVFYKGNSTAPQYDGQLDLDGLNEAVVVKYDQTGIPHIEAKNKADLYTAFGYVHAQDRLFQMELLRRAGSGRLAEIIGEPMIKVDKMFHTIGLPQYAEQSAKSLRQDQNSPMYRDIICYLNGINAFIAKGEFSPEFMLMGFEPKPFTVEDLYAITGAMSFSFSQAQKTEPVISAIATTYDSTYLNDIGLWHQTAEGFIPNNFPDKINQELDSTIMSLSALFQEVHEALPFSPLQGSNAWVVGGKRTKSGDVMFCNDTHIGYLVPQTWYEAYLTCPDFEMYGHFMAAVPFALVGRNADLSWGLTMLLNDDMDFYYEKIEGDSVYYQGQRAAIETREVEIKVKDAENVKFTIRSTPHGPIVNDAFDGISADERPVSMRWIYTEKENKTVHAFYQMNNANDMATFETALPLIHAPGLSINYGDKAGNIAWWACAQLIHRPAHVNSWTILDGASGNDDWQEFIDFKYNPRSINPERGFIYSANNWPEKFDYVVQTAQGNMSVDSVWYPGYYKPEYRGDRITKLLSSRKDWDMESMKKVMTDTKSDADETVMLRFKTILNKVIDFNGDPQYIPYKELWPWDGQYLREDYRPTFFTKMLYHYLHGACADELGEEGFKMFLTTHQIQRAQGVLIEQETSPWWDDVNTKDKKETRADIIKAAFDKTLNELNDQFGSNPKIWNWRKACSLELKHPLGEVAMLRPFFNVGPQPVDGGNETIMQSGFLLNETGEYKVFFGSQMRIIVDFADVANGINMTPCGQSGHLFSKHYNDQFERYCNKEFRPQYMRKLFNEEAEDVLVLQPVYPN
jgi:penicillin amidase